MQCCLRVVSVEVLAHWLLLRFPLFEFWFLWVVVFCAREVSLEVLWRILGCFGWFFFGSLWLLLGLVRVPWAAFGVLGGCWGVPGQSCDFQCPSRGGLRENPGNFGRHFGSILEGFFMICQYMFEAVFSIDFIFDLASFWGSCWKRFFEMFSICFQTLPKMLHPTKTL